MTSNQQDYSNIIYNTYDLLKKISYDFFFQVWLTCVELMMLKNININIIFLGATYQLNIQLMINYFTVDQ